MREVKKFISIDNKEFNTEKECRDYEQEIKAYICDKLLFQKKCLDCQIRSLCQYLIEKNICKRNLCDFIMDKILEVFNK